MINKSERVFRLTLSSVLIPLLRKVGRTILIFRNNNEYLLLRSLPFYTIWLSGPQSYVKGILYMEFSSSMDGPDRRDHGDDNKGIIGPSHTL